MPKQDASSVSEVASWLRDQKKEASRFGSQKQACGKWGERKGRRTEEMDVLGKTKRADAGVRVWVGLGDVRMWLVLFRGCMGCVGAVYGAVYGDGVGDVVNNGAFLYF